MNDGPAQTGGLAITPELVAPAASSAAKAGRHRSRQAVPADAVAALMAHPQTPPGLAKSWKEQLPGGA